MNISVAEYSRTFYAWILKLIYFAGVIIGWTVITATVVARLDISFLPILILFEALFTLAGMFFFSVIVERTSVRKLIIISTVLAIVSLCAAAIFYEDNFLFILFSLIANGLFLGQTVIFLSNYIEEYFTPAEAERTFPIIESSETVGGILAGVFLAVFGLHLLNRDIFLIWMLLLFVFLLLLFVLKPAIPLSLEKYHKGEHKKVNKGYFDVNSIQKSLEQIRRVPFLQILLVVLVLNWVISIFIEFQFTKAVDESLVFNDHGDHSEHEKLLTHGLGTLHIIIHGSAFVFEMLFANRIIVKLGAFGSFLLHALLTALSVTVNVFAKGLFSSVLLKHNFVLSKIIQKSAYENTYYSYGNDMQKAMREFFEGIAYPLSCVLATLLIIGMQFLLMEQHFYYFTQLFIIFLIAGMAFFTYQMKSKYTSLNLANLYSLDKLTRMRAVNILVQKGHKETIEALAMAYRQSNDYDLRRLIVVKLKAIKSKRAVSALINFYELSSENERRQIVKSVVSLIKIVKENRKLMGNVIEFFNNRLEEDISMTEYARILASLAIISGKGLSQYRGADNPLMRALAILEIRKSAGGNEEAKREIRAIIEDQKIDSKWSLVFLAGKIRCGYLKDYVFKNVNTTNPELKVICLFAAIGLHRYEYVSQLVKFLLFGGNSEFRKSIDVLDIMPSRFKMHIDAALLPHGFLDEMPDTPHARHLLERLEELFIVCEDSDDNDFLQYNVSSLIPVYKFKN